MMKPYSRFINVLFLSSVLSTAYAGSKVKPQNLTVTTPATIVYIDPSAGNSIEDGTITNPLKSWQNVEWTNNTTYLQKRGTVFICNQEITIQADNVTISAYGEGARPILRETIGTTFKMLTSNNSNITIKNLEIHSTTGKPTVGIEAWFNPGKLLIDSCLIHGQMWGIRVIKTTGTLQILNTEIHHTFDDGIFTMKTGNVEIAYCNIYEVNQGWWDSPDVNNAVSGGDCIQIAYGQAYSYIHDNILDHSTTGWKFCLIIGETDENSDSTADSCKIENNIMTGNKADINSCIYMKKSLEKVIVNGNTFKNGNYGIWCAGESFVYNNVFEDCVIPFLNLTDEIAHVYHNTFVRADEKFIGGDGKYMDVTKNVFIMPTDPKYGPFLYYNGGNSDYNLLSRSNSSFDTWKSQGHDANTIIGSPKFINYEKGNYAYSSSSSFGVNPGVQSTDHVLTHDKIGNPRDANPDMGAFEFVTTSLVTPALMKSIYSSGFSIYPPISQQGIYNILGMDTHLPIRYVTYSTNGTLLDDGVVNGTTKQLNFTAFDSGMYIIRLFIDNKMVFAKKVIKL